MSFHTFRVVLTEGYILSFRWDTENHTLSPPEVDCLLPLPEMVFGPDGEGDFNCEFSNAEFGEFEPEPDGRNNKNYASFTLKFWWRDDELSFGAHTCFDSDFWEMSIIDLQTEEGGATTIKMSDNEFTGDHCPDCPMNALHVGCPGRHDDPQNPMWPRLINTLTHL